MSLLLHQHDALQRLLRDDGDCDSANGDVIFIQHFDFLIENVAVFENVGEPQLEEPDILEIDSVVVRHEAERNRRVFWVPALEQRSERRPQTRVLHRETLLVPEIHKLALFLHPHRLLLVVPVELGHELEEHEHLPHFVVVIQRLAKLKLTDGNHDGLGAPQRRSRRLRR